MVCWVSWGLVFFLWRMMWMFSFMLLLIFDIIVLLKCKNFVGMVVRFFKGCEEVSIWIKCYVMVVVSGGIVSYKVLVLICSLMK